MGNHNPQLEDGFIRIANELFLALAARRIPPRESSVLIAIMYKTYGFNKKIDIISVSQIVEITGIDSHDVRRVIHRLIAKKMIVAGGTSRKRTLGINKNYSQWSFRHEGTGTLKSRNRLGVASPSSMGVASPSYKGVASPHTKDTRQLKDNPKDSGVKRKLVQKFIKPKIEEIVEYIREKNLNVDGCTFFHHYESQGWKVGSNAMKNWRSALQTWHGKNKTGGYRNGTTRESGYKSITKSAIEQLDAIARQSIIDSGLDSDSGSKPKTKSTSSLDDGNHKTFNHDVSR